MERKTELKAWLLTLALAVVILGGIIGGALLLIEVF